MLKLKNMYDTGVTLWNNPTSIFNYDVDNSLPVTYPDKPENPEPPTGGGGEDIPGISENEGYIVANGYNIGIIRPLTQYTITSRFGQRSGDYHTGIDLAIGLGTPIKAVASGTVVRVLDLGNTSYGKYVIIEHAQGIRTYYCHMSAFHVEEGQSVSQGATIGEVGSTGNSTGNHLHFEIRINNEPQNPENYLRF